jgi:hypothetical protein
MIATVRRHIAFLAAALVAGACGGSSPSPVGPSGNGVPLQQTVESPAFLFRFASMDTVDVQWQEQFHTWAIAQLQVSPTRRITYNKYMNRSHMGDLIGNYSTNGFAEPATYTIHTIWPIDNHETVHLYASLFGSPVALFSEGIAVAHQTNPARQDFVPKWSGVPIHRRAIDFGRAGTLVPLARLLQTNDFRTFDPNVTYPESGSWVRYLIDTYGLVQMKRLFALSTPSDSAETVRRIFQTIYGRPIESVEPEWLTFIESQ